MLDIKQLQDLGQGNLEQDKMSIPENTLLINQTFEDFGVDAEVVKVTLSAITTQYFIKLGRGVKVREVTSLKDNLALALSTDKVEIGAEKGYIKLSVNNSGQGVASFKEAMLNKQSDKPLAIEVGTDTDGKAHTVDLAKAPHMLVAGATGSGKSVFLNSVVCDLIINQEPEDVQITLIDPKRVEFSQYKGVQHVREVVTDTKQAAKVLSKRVEEMDNLYAKFEADMVKDIKGYNKANPDDKKPYQVIIIDEMADLMIKHPEIEESLIRLAQLGRAAGYHIILATQRPTVEVITGNLKANIPSRVAFRVPSGVDSRTILGRVGAENLKGNGDMLLKTDFGEKRVQGLYLTDEDIKLITDAYRGEQSGDTNDTLIDLARGRDYITLEELMEKYSIGYIQALQIVQEMQERRYLGKLSMSGYEVLV